MNRAGALNNGKNKSVSSISKNNLNSVSIVNLPKFQIIKSGADVNSFLSLVKNSHESKLFVDKTLLIKDIIDHSNSLVLITRPRRWGKSINLSMLYSFFVNRDQLRLIQPKNEIIEEYDEIFQD